MKKTKPRVYKIKLLKWKAKKLYRSYTWHMSQYDCGKALSELIISDITRIKNEFNVIMDKLKEIDPDYIDFKLN